MPWREPSLMQQRLDFVREHARGHWPMAALCAQYGISEKTGYKWVARFVAGGPAALADRSHATHACPHRVAARLTDAILALRRAPDVGAAQARGVPAGAIA